MSLLTGNIAIPITVGCKPSMVLLQFMGRKFSIYVVQFEGKNDYFKYALSSRERTLHPSGMTSGNQNIAGNALNQQPPLFLFQQ